MMSVEFNRDFQIRLLINMLLDQKFFERAIGQVHLEDFGLPACRLLLEVTRRYYFAFKKLPSFDTLQLEVIRALDDQTGTIETRLTLPDHESLATIMGWIARTPPTALDTAYFGSRLIEFLQHTRLAQIPQDGHNAATYIQAVATLSEQLNKTGGGDFTFTNAASPIPEDQGSAQERLGIGVPRVDRLLANGLTRKQMGMLVAFTGIGKTTGLINTLVNAVLHGKHCLFITLELPVIKIMERYQMILGMIEAKWFKVPRAKWPEEMKRRWRYITSPDSPVPGSMTVMEKIGGATVFDIDKMIYAFKQHKEQEGIDPASCCVVAVDWIGRVDATGARGVNRDSGDERRNFHVMEHLDEYTNKHDIWLWSAAQAGAKAEGKEVLTCRDISWGVSQHHLLAASLGIAPKQVDRVVAEDASAYADETNEDTGMNATQASVEPPCDRTLIISLAKMRDAATTGFHEEVYQGPTLRLWNNFAAFEAAETTARSTTEDGLGCLLKMRGQK